MSELHSNDEAATAGRASPVENGIRTILADALKRRPDDISLDADLESGLGLDSMTMIDVSVSIEERFDIALPQFAAPGEIAVRTVGDLIRFVETKVAQKASKGAS